MKKILLISLMLVLSLSLSSCGNEKAEEKIDNKVTNQEEKQIEISEKINNEMKDGIKEISDKIASWEITSEDAEKLMIDSMNNSETVKSQLEIEQEQMPKMLQIIKANRECFDDVDNKSDADKCVEEAEELAKKLGVEEFYSEDEEYEEDEWIQEDKEEMLAEMDIYIKQMEQMLPCILDAEVMTDLMNCSVGE